MATVEIDTTKLQAALDGLGTLIGNVRSAALRASNETPVPLPSLEGAELTGLLAWFEDQKPELKTRLDLAKLLDTDGNGKASYEVAHGDQLWEVKNALGDNLAKQLEDLDINNPEDRKRATELANLLLAYKDDKAVSTRVMKEVGPLGLTSIVAKLRDLTSSDMDSYVNLNRDDDDAAYDLQDLMGKGLAGMLATASGELGTDWAKKFGEGDPYTSAVLLNYADRSNAKFDGAFWTTVGLGLKKRADDMGAPWGMGNDPTTWHFGSMHLDHPPNPMTEYLNGSDNSTAMAQGMMGNKELREYFMSGDVPEVGKGNQLGNVLRVATVDAARSDNDQVAKNAAEISSQVLWFEGGKHKPLEGIKEELGGIVATYIMDADRVFDTGGEGGPGVNMQYADGNYPGPVTGKDGFPRFGINMDQAHLRGVMEDIGDNDTAVSVVGKATTGYNQIRLDRGAAEHYGHLNDPNKKWETDTPGDPLIAATSESSDFAGFMADSFVNGKIDSEEEATAQRKKIAGYFTAPLDLIKTDEVPLVGDMVIGGIKEAVIEAAGGDSVPGAISKANDTDQSTANMTKLQALYAIQKHGSAEDKAEIDWPKGSDGKPLAPTELDKDGKHQIQSILEQSDKSSGSTKTTDSTVDAHHKAHFKEYGDN